MPGSDLERIGQLRDRFFGSGGFADAFNASYLEPLGFTENYIDDLVRGADLGHWPRKSKVVKDSTWGMLEVNWETLRLLDSPLVQRLRWVKQLGFSYLTYPSAEHSRFAHSLGMCGVVSKFLESMHRPWPLPSITEGIERVTIGADLQLDLLHAAILHDVGHLPFSHALEDALEGDAAQFFCGGLTVDDVLFTANELLRKKLRLSECLSLIVVLSPRFEKFYSRFVRPHSEDKGACLRIAALIAGLRPTDLDVGAGQLISNSPIDADKVDYINRDSEACGIPVGIDVARLFLRSSFFRLSPDVLERLHQRRPSSSEIHFVVNASGVDTIDELAHARAALYQRVYLHQTTRNAERILTKAIESLPPSTKENPEPLRDVFGLLTLHDDDLLTRLRHHQKPRVRSTAERLVSRKLPKRACVFGRSLATPLMPIAEILPGLQRMAIAKHTVGTAIARLRRQDELNGARQSALETTIGAEAASLARALKLTPEESASLGEAPDIVSILPMTELNGLTREAIVLESNDLIFSSDRSISDEQNEAADLYKALGYVLCDPPWRDLVCLAARKLLARSFVEPVRPMALRQSTGSDPTEAPATEFEVRCAGRVALDLRKVARRAGLNYQKVMSLQTQAARAGFFDDTPWLVTVDESDCDTLAAKLKDFHGQNGWRVTRSSCASFFSQFPPGLRAEAIGVLTDKMCFLDRGTTARHLQKVVRSLKTSARMWITGLTPNSGSRVRDLLEQDVKSAFESADIHFAKSAEEALRKMNDVDELVLVDDNISSGSQAQCQLRAWLGIPRLQWPVAHRAESGINDVPLADPLKRKLLKVKTSLAICVGPDSADNGLRELAATVGLSGFNGVHLGTTGTEWTAAFSASLQNFLRRVGAELYGQFKFGSIPYERLNEEQLAECDANSLGYDNVQGALATYFNVPTSTLTALWCPGMALGHPWMPLLIRRGHLKRLVVA